jgi:hypothetical protein
VLLPSLWETGAVGTPPVDLLTGLVKVKVWVTKLVEVLLTVVVITVLDVSVPLVMVEV